MRFEFQTGSVDTISRVPANMNLADPLTKKERSLTDLLELSLFTGGLKVDLETVSARKCAQKYFG